MKYEVNYVCGHTGTVELFGNGRDREIRIAYLATIDCPECAKAAKDAVIVKYENENGLPELNGTEKQVAWARKIRFDRFEVIENMQADERHSIQEVDALKKKLSDWLKSKTDAKFFIDTRDEFNFFAKHRSDWNI